MPSALFEFTTNLPASTGIQHGPTAAYGSNKTNPTLVTSHAMTLTEADGLVQGQLTHARAYSTLDGQTVYSDDITFTPPRSLTVLSLSIAYPLLTIEASSAVDLTGYWFGFEAGTGTPDTWASMSVGGVPTNQNIVVDISAAPFGFAANDIVGCRAYINLATGADDPDTRIYFAIPSKVESVTISGSAGDTQVLTATHGLIVGTYPVVPVYEWLKGASGAEATAIGTAIATYLQVTGDIDSYIVCKMNAGDAGAAKTTSNEKGPVGAANGLLTNLISYWKLDELDGNADAVDSQGTNTLTSFSAKYPGTGKLNTGRTFVLADHAYFTLASNLSLAIATNATSFTYSLWFKPNSLATYQMLLSKATLALYGAGLEYQLQIFQTTGQVVVYLGKVAAPTYEALVAPNVVSVGNWSHIVFGYDAADHKIFVSVDNATKTKSPALTDQTVAGTNPFWLGMLGDSTQWTDGVLDEIGFWKRALSQDEIAQLFNSGAGLPFGSFT